MAIVYALCSALTYGLSDFVGGLVSRRTSAWSVAVVAQLSSTVCTVGVATLVSGSPRPGDFAWAVLAGVASGIGTGFLYRGFAAGRMGVVAPVSAVGAALVPVLAGALSGERPTLLVWLGVGSALPAIWLVSSSPRTDPPPVERSASSAPTGPVTARATSTEGVLDGVLAGLGFGVLFAALGQIPEQAGLWPLAAAQAVSVPTVILLAGLLGALWRPQRTVAWWALLAGPLGATATGTFLLASQSGYLTVAGVLAALYPATTVLLAALVLHEKIHRVQAIGLALCAVAVALVAGG